MSSRHIGDYVIERLQGLGVRHVFGVPGDYVAGFRGAHLDSLDHSAAVLRLDRNLARRL
ncbi:MAG: hypothetical protein ACLQVY_24925 [Limisphaerales bacterium]